MGAKGAWGVISSEKPLTKRTAWIERRRRLPIDKWLRVADVVIVRFLFRYTAVQWNVG